MLMVTTPNPVYAEAVTQRPHNFNCVSLKENKTSKILILLPAGVGAGIAAHELEMSSLTLLAPHSSPYMQLFCFIPLLPQRNYEGKWSFGLLRVS